MKTYCEIGERTKWNRNRYRCVEFTDHESGNDNCAVCGLQGAGLVCNFIACKKKERTDKKDVFFRLEPRFRKEEKQ